MKYGMQASGILVLVKIIEGNVVCGSLPRIDCFSFGLLFGLVYGSS